MRGARAAACLALAMTFGLVAGARAYAQSGARAPVSAQASAQAGRTAADRALLAGDVARAEAMYFVAAKQRPRDPRARLALGQYLAGRGAWKVGAVLVEEARRFGGSREVAASVLAPLYVRTGDFTALLSLEPSPLTRGARARARWLRTNRPSFAAPDTVSLPLLPAADSRSVGAIRLVVGGDTMRVEIDPSASGLALDGASIRTPGIRSFDADPDGTRPAAANRISAGALTIRNVPVLLRDAGGAGRGRAGLDWLGEWAPTIDFVRGAVTLRRSGTVPASVRRQATSIVAVLHAAPTRDGAWVPGTWAVGARELVRLDAAQLRAGQPRRVTYDPRRGELLVVR